MDTEEIKKLNLRLPASLHAWLKAKAKSEGRSLQRQIVWLLEQARIKKEG